jgi:hypothetical protein
MTMLYMQLEQRSVSRVPWLDESGRVSAFSVVAETRDETRIYIYQVSVYQDKLKVTSQHKFHISHNILKRRHCD